MYDGEFFAEGLMQLYDVGMASMHTMDTAALAQLAKAIGRDADAAMLQARAAKMTALIETHLWDEQSGIYVNRRPNGSFYRHVAPTSFYAMQTAGPSQERVETLVGALALALYCKYHRHASAFG
jgi:neutral trehalase